MRRSVSKSFLSGLAAGAAVLLLLAGCETTRPTTLEVNSAFSEEARAFLEVGETTSEQVRGKYGKPQAVEPYEDGVRWRYRWSDTVVVNAFSGTPLGTDGAILSDTRGFQHTVVRRTQLDLFFDKEGVLADYRILRNAP